MLEIYTVLSVCVVVALMLHVRAMQADAKTTSVRLSRRMHDAIGAFVEALPPAAPIFALIVLFFVQLALIRRMDIVLNPASFKIGGAPVLFSAYDNFLVGVSDPHRRLLDIGFAAIVSCEALALYALYRILTLRPAMTRTTVVTLISGAVIMLFAALTARATVSSDVYGYIGYAKYGFSAYTTKSYVYSGAFASLNAVNIASWKVLAPCPYGPLWLAVNTLAIAPAQTLWQAICIERVIGMLGVFACGFALFRLSGSLALVAIFVLNPMVLFNYVAEAHNDILGLACVLLAAVAFRRNLILGIVLQAAAGLTKLPFLLIGIIAANSRASLVVRFASAFAAFVLMLAGAWLFGGAGYLGALLNHVHENDQSNHLQSSLAHVVLLLVALCALALAFFRRTYLKEAVPAFAALAATLYPWYLAMILPYAVIGEAAPVTYIATLPMFGLFVDPVLGTRVVKSTLIVCLLIWAYVAKATAKREQTPLHTEA